MRRRPYIGTDSQGRTVKVLADHLFPHETYTFQLQTTKARTRKAGPNYDHTMNSVYAAILYEHIRPTMRNRAWRMLYDANGQYLHGQAIEDACGSEALRRVRELDEVYGWPIEKRPNGIGPWDYRMNLPQTNLPSSGKRYIRRRHP